MEKDVAREPRVTCKHVTNTCSKKLSKKELRGPGNWVMTEGMGSQGEVWLALRRWSESQQGAQRSTVRLNYQGQAGSMLWSQQSTAFPFSGKQSFVKRGRSSHKVPLLLSCRQPQQSHEPGFHLRAHSHSLSVTAGFTQHIFATFFIESLWAWHQFYKILAESKKINPVSVGLCLGQCQEKNIAGHLLLCLLCVCVHMCVIWHVYERDQRIACGSMFSPSSVWIPMIKLAPLHVAVRAFTW